MMQLMPNYRAFVIKDPGNSVEDFLLAKIISEHLMSMKWVAKCP